MGEDDAVKAFERIGLSPSFVQCVICDACMHLYYY